MHLVVRSAILQARREDRCAVGIVTPLEFATFGYRDVQITLTENPVWRNECLRYDTIIAAAVAAV